MKPIDGIHIDQPTTNASGTSFRNRVVTLENKSLLLPDAVQKAGPYVDGRCDEEGAEDCES